MRARRRSAALVLPILLALGAPVVLSSQQDDDFVAPAYVADVTFLGANALLGAMTGGVAQWARGGSFQDGFTRGAAGGAVAYAGRRLAAERFDGAGLLGRQLSAVGIAMVRNASVGRPSFEALVFPVGPLQLHLDRSDGTTIRPKVSVVALVQAVTLALQEETRFDLSASLSAGAPVFRSPGRQVLSGGEAAWGMMTHGSVILSDQPPQQLPSTFAHERVHLLQHDFAEMAWTDPIEEAILKRFGPTRRLAKYVHPGVLHLAATGALFAIIDVEWGRRPWEIEARHLGGR
jgi:hypothetical protein